MPGPDWREQLERESAGVVEIVVHRAVEVALWSQAIELSHAGFFHQLLAAGDDPDDDRADHAGTTVERGEPRRNAGEKGKRVDREREQQPTEKPDSDGAKDYADDDHGGGLRERSGRARFHHLHGAGDSIAGSDGRP
jgi:hypothetical protein